MQTILGIDGGGSKTAFLLVDSQGHELARTETGPSNYTAIGRVRSAEAIRRGISALPRTPDVIIGGFAGAGGRDGAAHYRETLAALAPQSRIGIGTDAHIAYHGALGERSGVVVIAGTGSILIGRQPNGRLFRSGGWGYLFGDEGGGFWIGREAVRTALAFDEDGRGSDFPHLVAGHLGLDAIASAGRAWADQTIDVARVASLARLLVDRLPSEPGNGILRAAGQHLGRLVDQGVRRVGDDACPVVLVGSIGALPVVRAAVGRTLTPPEGTPLEGAVRWARDRVREGRPLDMPPLD